ncbi:unnamed protein product [Cylindrotheca closterium]|uniref:PDZ domain-containing protein n=1 Tax=Cylindrotheca closterium TaxID=2856 RepID=A0AAD2CN11_9STRA|nr:unnamed protein product [Cylindrotheca closterium]
MIDETNISRTTSTCNEDHPAAVVVVNKTNSISAAAVVDEGEESSSIMTTTTTNKKKKPPTTTTTTTNEISMTPSSLQGEGVEVEQRDMMDMLLEQASEEFRVLLIEDHDGSNGVDEVEVVPELRQSSSCESSDEWSDNDNDEDDDNNNNNNDDSSQHHHQESMDVVDTVGDLKLANDGDVMVGDIMKVDDDDDDDSSQQNEHHHQQDGDIVSDLKFANDGDVVIGGIMKVYDDSSSSQHHDHQQDGDIVGDLKLANDSDAVVGDIMKTDDDSSSSQRHDHQQDGDIVGDLKLDDDNDNDNQSTDEWGDEQKLSFEKVMDFIAFPEKHLFQSQPSQEGVEVDNELGVMNVDTEYGSSAAAAAATPAVVVVVQEEKKEEDQEEQAEQEKEQLTAAEETTEEAKAKINAKTTKAKETATTTTLSLTVDTTSVDEPSSVPPPKSFEQEKEEEDSKKTNDPAEGEESVEVVLPADHKLASSTEPQNSSDMSSMVTTTTSPRQWFANWFQPDQRIVATVTKESKNEPLGVFIKKVLLKDGLYISQLQVGSQVASTDLKPGMKILVINSMPCPQTVKEFRDLVSTMEGEVTIVAQLAEDENEGLVVVTVFKETKSQPLGLVLKSRLFKEGLVVAKILDGSIFCNTALKEGMRIIRVNDQQCPGSVDAFRVLLKEIDGQVKIVAEPTVAQCQQAKQAAAAAADKEKKTEDKEKEKEDEKEKKPDDSNDTPEVASMPKIFKYNGIERKEVVCKIVKNGTHEPLGLLLREFKDEEGIHVLQMDETAKLGATTALKPGMTIHQINGQNCPNKVEECIKLLRSIDGLLTIVASEIYED